MSKGLPWWLSGKESAYQCRCGFDPWVRKIPWRREWQYTPVQRSLEGYRPWGHKESDTTLQLSNNNKYVKKEKVLIYSRTNKNTCYNL